MYSKVTIVGVGLIGGSFGLAVRRSYPEARITGVDSPETIEAAIAMGAIADGVDSLEEAVGSADLIVLARTVDGILEDLPLLGECLRGKITVTDVGSTKAEICRTAWGIHGKPWLFHGGHPMAGSEKTGVVHASADLFRNRPYLLCPDPASPAPEIDRLEKFLAGLGGRVRRVDPQRHDRIVAAVSHLPQMAALGLASVLGWRSAQEPDLADFAGPALREMSRVAGSDFRLWKGICATNREEIRQAIEEFRQALELMAECLEEPSLEDFFRSGNRLANIRKSADPEEDS